MSDRINIDTDVSSLGNPGPGGYGIIMMRDTGTWSFYTSEHAVNAVKRFDNGVAYAVGDNGMVLKTGVLTGLNEAVKDSDSFALFPNPASDNIQITGIASGTIDFIQLFDQQGRVVKRFPASETSLLLPPLPSGVYNLKVSTKGKNLVQKVIIQ